MNGESLSLSSTKNCVQILLLKSQIMRYIHLSISYGFTLYEDYLDFAGQLLKYQVWGNSVSVKLQSTNR